MIFPNLFHLILTSLWLIFILPSHTFSLLRVLWKATFSSMWSRIVEIQMQPIFQLRAPKTSVAVHQHWHTFCDYVHIIKNSRLLTLSVTPAVPFAAIEAAVVASTNSSAAREESKHMRKSKSQEESGSSAAASPTSNKTAHKKPSQNGGILRRAASKDADTQVGALCCNIFLLAHFTQLRLWFCHLLEGSYGAIFVAILRLSTFEFM